MDNKNNGGWKLKPHIKMFCKIAATMIIIYCMIGSIAVIAQEGQIIKEIKITTTVKNKDVTYKYDNPILLYPGNIIKLHCIVNPTLNYSIKKSYLNITRKDGGIDPISFPLRIKHNEKGDYIDDPIDWTLTKDVDLDGIYLAKIDLVTTNISVPDAGAYVSLKMSFSGVPIIIKFEDINPNGVFDEGTDRLLPGWKFTVEDPDGLKSTYETADDGTIQLDPVAVGGRYKQIKEEKTDNWISQPPPGMEDEGYTVQKENSGDENVLYFANNLKPATLQLVKYEDRNDNNIPDLDLGEGLLGRSFKVTGSGFSDVGVTNETGVAVIDGIPFLSITGLPDDRPMQRYNITEGPMAGWRALSPIVEELYPGDNRIVYIENVLLSGKVNVRKYVDINGNNRYDLDEGCPGWTITITGPGVDQTKNTDENGVASFDIGFKTDSARPNELPKNQYIIHEKPKDNWENVVDQSITLGPNEEKTVDIENTPLPGIIVVHKFEDKNDNGKPDAGEEGAGWTFRVQGNGVRNPTATTNESGMASFIVDFKSDAGSACQPQTQELVIHEVPKNCYEVQPDQQIELSPGKRQDRTFVNRIPPVTLVIQKFYDANKNAVLDPGEDDGEKYPLSGWQYEIAYQGNVQSLTTDRGGTTSITLPVSVPEVECTIREVTDRPGWICTTTNPRQIKISCENPTLQVEFGNKADRIIIKKFNDSNINSRQDDGEDGLPGWRFDIMSPDGSTITAGPTNNDGIIMKEGLLPGSYAIREVLQDGWINTTSLTVTVDVRAGEDALVPAFGNIKSSRIELFKFNDTDKNEKFDSYENGLPGWIFAVRCPNGSVVTSRPTNAKGVTSMERLTPGVYTVTENLVEGWINTTPLIRSINLSIGDEEKLSFGNYYCLPCHRFENRMPPISTDGDIKVMKKVSNLSTENINRVSGNEVSYNITICPTRRIDEIASIPTDIVIAVDNSPSIINMRKSAVDGVRKLAEDIAANDKSHVTRIGLVSWSDENNSGVEVPLIDNYTEVAGKASKITFAEGKYTKYGIGIDKSTEAFDEDSAGKEKKIVIITDASDNGYVEPRFTDIDLSGYSIFAIVVGEKNETKALSMLNELTGKHRGYVIPINDLSELGEALVKTATAGSLMKNVHLVEVLPNYLALNNSTAIDDGGRVKLNGDSKDWTTTTITWDIGDLSDCWSTDFRAVFCWKLPADANQPQRNSYVNYTDEKGMSRTLALPEHEINILPGTKSEPVATATSDAKPEKEAPGFHGILAAIGISIAGYFYRRRED